jgi:hypothetical protein
MDTTASLAAFDLFDLSAWEAGYRTAANSNH